MFKKRLKLRLSLRNMATIVACLAVTMFASCEKDPNDGDENADGIAISDADYYGNNQDALQIALRNVRIKYWVQDTGCDLSPDCDEKKYSETMICKGRHYYRTNFVGARGENLYKEGWGGYDTNGILRGYNFIKNEMYAVDWYTTPPQPFEVTTGMERDAALMLEQYYRGDLKSNYWNEPYTQWYGSQKISTTTVIKADNERTIAGRLCNMYSIVRTLFQANGTSMDYDVRKAWYDPETNVTMRVEEYDTYGLMYVVEITEIEYGKVTVGQLDRILEDYLGTHSPKDVSDDESPGWDW